MAVEVKKEVYGSRPSIIEPILQKNKINYIKDIFILTCRAEFNKDQATRYLVLVEFNNEKSMDINTLKAISKCLKVQINKRVVGLSLKEKESKATLLFVNNVKKEFSFKELRNFLLEKTYCEYKKSHEKGSEHATALSRFFREKLGKSVSITDIDFFIPDKCLFLEEKTFISTIENEKYGYLAKGQCFSYKELINDLIDKKKSSVYLVFVNNIDFYLKKFGKSINCFESEHLNNWGDMVKIKLNKNPIKSDDLIKFISL